MNILVLGRAVPRPDPPVVALSVGSLPLFVEHNGRFFRIRVTTNEAGIEPRYRSAGKKVGIPIPSNDLRLRGYSQEKVDLPPNMIQEIQSLIEAL